MDIDIYVCEILMLCLCLNEILVWYIGQLLEIIVCDIECDNFKSVFEVMVYGLVDQVLECCLEELIQLV